MIVQTVALWDLRNLKLKLHSFESHKDEIFQVTLLLSLVRHENTLSVYNLCYLYNREVTDVKLKACRYE